MAKPRNILKPTNQNMSQPTHVNPYAQDHWWFLILLTHSYIQSPPLDTLQ